MSSSAIISTERQARELETEIERLSRALSSEQTLKSIIEGLPDLAIEGIRRSLATEKRELSKKLDAYRQAQDGDVEPMKRQVGDDLGDILIIARLAQKWTQKDLARKLGLQEQAIQRWESERYRSINLANYMKVARALSLDLSAQFLSPKVARWRPPFDLNPAEAQKILKHARQHGWLGEQDSDETGIKRLIRYVSEHVGRYGTPSLLRTGINVKQRQ